MSVFERLSDPLLRALGLEFEEKGRGSQYRDVKTGRFAKTPDAINRYVAGINYVAHGEYKWVVAAVFTHDPLEEWKFELEQSVISALEDELGYGSGEFWFDPSVEFEKGLGLDRVPIDDAGEQINTPRRITYEPRPYPTTPKH